MLKCKKCNGRVFIDRRFTAMIHVETYCILCGDRRFYHPPQNSVEGRWLLASELSRAKITIATI